MKSDQTSTVVC